MSERVVHECSRGSDTPVVVDGDTVWFAPPKPAPDASTRNTPQHVSGGIRLVLHAGRPGGGRRPAQRRIAVRLRPGHPRPG